MTEAENDKRKLVYILVGPKGSGKTHIGSLLEKEIGLKFLSVEKLGLENIPKSRLTGYELEKEGFHHEERAIDRILTEEAAMSFEATGSSEYFYTVLDRLRAKYKVKLVKVFSPLPTCYHRIKQRGTANHIPVSEEKIKTINEKAAKVDLNWALTIDNSTQPANEQILHIWKTAFSQQVKISFRPFDAGKDSEILARFLIDTKSLDGTTPEDPAKDCEAYIASVIAAQQRDPAFAAIMLCGEERIGFVHVYPVIQKPEIAFLPFDYLVKERRGLGLGKHLMDYAVNTARARGCTKLVLDVSKTNAPAISFYRRHGFETVKEHGLLFRMRRDI